MITNISNIYNVRIINIRYTNFPEWLFVFFFRGLYEINTRIEFHYVSHSFANITSRPQL